jgi:SAM-dependent methyltransferase
MVDESKIGHLTFRCNICGAFCESKVNDLGRETPSCAMCGSTVRMRAIIYLLSQALFGCSIALPNFPIRKDIRGIGLSDWIGYAIPLAQKLNYTNTFYHQEPRLDITAVDPAWEGTLDFLISTDVFEHIAPPVSVAFVNVHKLLKPNGVFIFTVPYGKDAETEEHFPELFQYEIVEREGKQLLKNITRDGREQIFENLKFHGGEGATLEMRLFSESALLKELAHAGFRAVKTHAEPDWVHGVYWAHDWSLPMTARK